MADPENTSLLSEGVAPALAPEPTLRTRRLTYAGFGLIGLLALIVLFSGGVAGFFFTLLSFSLCGYIGYRIFTLLIEGRVGGTEITRASALSYVACVVPAGLVILVVSLLSWIVLVIIFGIGIGTFQPKWATDIASAGIELRKHGQLLYDGKPVMKLIGRHHRLGHSSIHGAVAHVVLPSEVRHPIRLIPATTRVFSATSKHIHSIGSSFVGNHGLNRGKARAPALALSKLNETHSKRNELVFEDGTKAKPLIADFLLAISRIPLLLILVWLAVNSYFLDAYIPERTKQWIAEGYALKRPNATLRSVTASCMALGLGYAILAVGITPANSIITVLLNGFIFWVTARVAVAFSEIIGLLSYTNSVSAPGVPKKVVVLIPVLVEGSIQFLWSLIIIGFIKRVLPAAVMVLTSEVMKPESLMGAVIWIPIYIIVSLILTAGAYYMACRIAYTKTTESTAVF